MWRCLNCGAELIWQSDFDYEDYGYEGEGVVQIFSCPRCGAEIEMSVPSNTLPYMFDNILDKNNKWSGEDFKEEIFYKLQEDSGNNKIYISEDGYSLKALIDDKVFTTSLDSYNDNQEFRRIGYIGSWQEWEHLVRGKEYYKIIDELLS